MSEKSWVTEHQIELRASRRERIATALMAQMEHRRTDDWTGLAMDACALAEALMAELDRRLAAELQEARI